MQKHNAERSGSARTPVALELLYQPSAVLQIGVEGLHRLDDFLHFLFFGALKVLRQRGEGEGGE